MNKILIVCDSRSGTARQVARQLQQITGWAIGEVRDVRPRKGFGGDLRCIVDSLFARSAPYTYEGSALEGFARLVVLTPIWLDGLAAPMRALLRDTRHPGRRLSLICVMSRGGASRAADEVTTIVGAEPALVLGLTQSNVLSGNCLPALQSFVDDINAIDSEPAVARPIWSSPTAA